METGLLFKVLTKRLVGWEIKTPIPGLQVECLSIASQPTLNYTKNRKLRRPNITVNYTPATSQKDVCRIICLVHA